MPKTKKAARRGVHKRNKAACIALAEHLVKTCPNDFDMARTHSCYAGHVHMAGILSKPRRGGIGGLVWRASAASIEKGLGVTHFVACTIYTAYHLHSPLEAAAAMYHFALTGKIDAFQSQAY